jgi:hypothetical protein
MKKDTSKIILFALVAIIVIFLFAQNKLDVKNLSTPYEISTAMTYNNNAQAFYFEPQIIDPSYNLFSVGINPCDNVNCNGECMNCFDLLKGKSVAECCIYSTHSGGCGSMCKKVIE